MQQERFFNRSAKAVSEEVQFKSASRKTVIGIILVVALVAFEIFNFDTTRFALNSLLGDMAFMGITWATILATAFCAIDFAGLARLLTPERGAEEPKAVWYLMGAWLLGATMNAVMTWWAVSLTLISHEFGNEVLARETLLKLVPIFVAALVLLTRILFIGAFSVAGEHVFDLAGSAKSDKQPAAGPRPALPTHPPVRATTAPAPVEADDEPPSLPVTNRRPATGGRTYQRPPTPSGVHNMPAPMQAKSRDR